MSIGVFISYNHVDQRIANELSGCLVALSESIQVFIDHATISPGDDYEDRISKSINDSQWFIMLNPGGPSSEKDMGWCIYEAGQFRNRMASQAVSDKVIGQRICVAHDVTIPSQLSRYQAIRIQDRTTKGEPLDLDADNSRIEATPVFALFTAILERSEDKPIRDTSQGAVRVLIRDQARRFIKAFLTEQTDTRLDEVPLQPRISLTLPPSPANGLTSIDPSTEVVGWEKALPEVFGITGTKTTWAQIKSAFKLPSGADALWLQDLEEALISVAGQNVPKQSNMLCRGKNGSLFRPVVARYFPFVSGRREVFISLIQAPRRSLLPNDARSAAVAMLSKQHVLLIALVFAFRFKQQVLTMAEVAASTEKGATERLRSVLMRIEREIMILEDEAEAYGFDVSEDHLDRPQLADTISAKTDQDIVKRASADWAILRAKLVALLSDLRNPKTDTSATDVSTEVIQGLIGMKEANKKFTEAVIRELVTSQGLNV